MTPEELQALVAANAQAIASLTQAQTQERHQRSAQLEAEIANVVAMIGELSASVAESMAAWDRRLIRIEANAEASSKRLTRLEALAAETLAICNSNARAIQSLTPGRGD